MMPRAAVLRLTRYRAKGVQGETAQAARFLAGLGMEGDFRAAGGERQVSLLSRGGREWMDAQTERGLCFGRYKENILLDAGPAFAPAPGARLSMGEAVLEISGAAKRCFGECPLRAREPACVLAGRSLFAKVVRGGIVRTGDCAEALTEAT